MKKLLLLMTFMCIFLCGCNSVCDSCKKDQECEEYTYTVYDKNLKKNIEKTYNLCAVCHAGAEISQKDNETYDYMILACQVALTDDEAMAAMKKIDKAYITVSTMGVTYDNVPQEFIDAIHRQDALFDYNKITLPDAKIKIYSEDGNVYIKRDVEPFNLLGEINK